MTGSTAEEPAELVVVDAPTHVDQPHIVRMFVLGEPVNRVGQAQQPVRIPTMPPVRVNPNAS